MNNDKFTSASKAALIARAKRGKLYSPSIIFSEVCIAYSSKEEVQKIFDNLKINIVDLDKDALYQASMSFKKFLKRNKKTSRSQFRSHKRILPDFYIGAFAETNGIPLLTRDTRRKWSTDFPLLQILTP